MPTKPIYVKLREVADKFTLIRALSGATRLSQMEGQCLRGWDALS